MLLSDLTSGFNTATDISLEQQVHDLCGFTEPEVIHMTQAVGRQCDFASEQIEQMIALMRTFYNGYTFQPSERGLLYNPTLTLYFLDKTQLQPLCDFIQSHVYRAFSNRAQRAPDRHANELTIKALFLSLLYNDLFYITDSEPELHRRYADLLMLLRPAQRVFQLFDLLIEFKYVELTQIGLNAERVRSKTAAELATFEVIKSEFAAARNALQAYRQTLQTKYGTMLKLRIYTVVSLGFERVLWEEVAQ